ncbi:Sulfate/thiosulfate import ATP-binding protein CysA [Pseudomonas sp. THAF187a]|uniref:Molybdate transporter subunit ATP-binding component of ABC superfamily n=1 Tax=Ectopseudomonas oleovorans TaxID=301 RepID=A0A653B3T8_ECTOL|nr:MULTISPECIES: molybdenum ABC transporter ATP-binding protein [unclassified Pseudomonas]QFT24462.1 Sulfate/thiosulfate import ATP-binding protein CysA [Pseudomonas sp. THAF187a]QFT44649.1 Sulfate/thiosulfate import ATP-binding protein CysA [Pseudomonas sp. THAF42]TNF06829.1 MAG: molybdenum ABC transporter ATP-binding protein [Pseudomonadales bacterium]CAE6962663.1 molybdate ABC transporter ATP binding subunit [Pseudomonas oleovorans]
MLASLFGKRGAGTPIIDDGRIRARFLLQHPGFRLDVDLDLPSRGVSALFGHSGSGKTSCLRCFAGLDRPREGYLQVAGERWQDSASGDFLPAHRRAIGYVFQDANLFPHLSVRGNLEFGQRRIAARERKVALDQALELLGIGHLLERLPSALSGGERQRVGIARALVTSPRLLLMDEPLASLDLKRKQEVLPYLERLHEELDIPVIYVSHAPDEVARLADHLVLLEDGQVRASGPLKELLLRTDLPFASDDDAEAVIDGQASAYDARYGLVELCLPGSEARLRLPHAALPAQQRVRVKIKARDVSLSLQRAEGSSLLNLLPVTVDSWQVLDAQVLLTLRLGEQRLLARITRYSFDQLGIHAGQAIWAQIKSVSLLAP